MSRPRLALFLALCAVQLAIPLAMAYRYERTLREGTVYRFHTEPFDPVDAFRGRYVAIRLTLTHASVQGEGERVFVALQRDADGFASVRTLSTERPREGDWLVGTTSWTVFRRPGDNDQSRSVGTRVELPFDRYYMEEGKAPAADRIWREGMQQAEAVARVRVRHGLGAIEGLDINGVPIEKWIETLPAEK
ncbi:MAG TPA: GDYXXLXY domain-containing protein [Candidatus Polarisedimenticolaceae bacterium]|nr:GDYXXLXY domain-containing protein [Candidatus Polarisedimenticolaceae bacterium]